MSLDKNSISKAISVGAGDSVPMLQRQKSVPPVYTYADDFNKKERTFDLFKILSTLFHRKWTIILTTLIFSLVALFISSMIKPAFKASTTIEISRNSYEVIEFGKVNSVDADKEFYSTQYGLLTSPTLASRVIKKLNLTASQLSFSNNKSSDEILETKIIEELFLSNLSISPVIKSRLVELSYENSDPRLASVIVNTLAETFIQSNRDKKSGATTYSREYLNNTVNETKQKLENSEIVLDDFASNNNIIKFDESQTLKLNALTQLEEMLAIAERESIDARSNQQQSLGNAGNRDVTNNLTIQALKQQKAQLVADYQEMLQTFKPNYPVMQQLQKRIQQITQEISLESNSIISNTRVFANNSFDASKQKVDKLREKVKNLKSELIQVQNKTTEYQNLKREVSSNQGLYSSLLKRLNEVTVAENVSVNNISVINKAVVPRNKIRPKRLLNLMAGMLLGLFTGSLLALFLEVTRGRIRSEEDLQQVANLPVLGKMPKIKSRSKVDASLLFNSKANSPLPEAIRSLRTNLTHAAGQKSPNSILFTSATGDEGKTSTAINLACAYILLGKTVLLIDADMRNPSIDRRLLKGQRKTGLSSYLSGQSDFAKITEISKIYKKLFVIPSGNIPENPVELLASKRMADLIKLGEQRFDVVIVDSPPVSDISDSVILSTFVDTTILSVQINKTRINDLSLALNRLANTKGNLLGVVATDVKYNYSRYRRPQQLFPALTNLT